MIIIINVAKLVIWNHIACVLRWWCCIILNLIATVIGLSVYMNLCRRNECVDNFVDSFVYKL